MDTANTLKLKPKVVELYFKEEILVLVSLLTGNSLLVENLQTNESAYFKNFAHC